MHDPRRAARMTRRHPSVNASDGPPEDVTDAVYGLPDGLTLNQAEELKTYAVWRHSVDVQDGEDGEGWRTSVDLRRRLALVEKGGSQP